MAKGTVAKERLTAMLAEGFGSRFLGIADKKIYILSEEDGELVPVALSMTCPKTVPEFDNVPEVTLEKAQEVFTVPQSPEEKIAIQNLLRMVQYYGFPV